MALTVEQRRQVALSTGPAKDTAEQYGVSLSTVYGYRKHSAAYADEPVLTEARAESTEFDQTAKSGLIRHGRMIEEEFMRELQDDGGAKLYTEMSVHPVISAVLFAIQMAQRKVNWFVEPASEDKADEEAAEFLESARVDMSQTWDDIVSQVFTMLKYGFAVCELVYKKRLGSDPPNYIEDPASSQFNDGKIGWRRWQFMSPRTLSPGGRWEFDEQGRVLSITQQPPPDYGDITVPIEKALLFRTRVEWDNPEGFSILRPMYRPWYYATNLSEVEAIGAERLGLGIPIVYMGNDTSKSGASSDRAVYEKIVRNVRADEQMGIVFDKVKLGTGEKGQGVLFELMSPPSRGFIDFDQVITRYEQRMAMTVLSQFIFLGMSNVGTQALASKAVDVFREAIGAWSTMMADVINRFAIPRLFELNAFGIKELPKLKHSEASVPNLNEIASFINALVGAQVITPDEQLEAHLRSMADLPEKPEEAVEIVEEGEEVVEDEVEPDDEESAEPFALKTIRGALARNEQGKFERGSGAPISDDDVADADALLNNRITPEQASRFKAAGLVGDRDGKQFLTPEGRGVARLMATNPKAALARMRVALRKAGATRAKTPRVEIDRGKKPTPGGRGGGTKGGKGKKKGAAKKGGGGKGKAKPEEKGKLDEAQQVQVNLLVEQGLSEELAVAMALIYDSDNPNQIVRAQDESIQAQLTELGLLGEDGKTISEDGRRLSRAVKNKDLETIAGILGEQSSEHFIQRTRQGGPAWERQTNLYERRLRTEYAGWSDRTARTLSNTDEAEFDDVLNDAIAVLVANMTRLGRENLPEGYQLGLAGVPSSPDGIGQLADSVRSNDQFVRDSLGPGVEAKVRDAVERDFLIREDEDSLRSVLGTFLARVGGYAGAYWALIMGGFVDRVRQDSDNPRVRWVRDSRAQHCSTCLQFGSDSGKVYENIDDLLAQTGGILPARGTVCLGNCRCHLEVETKPGVWVRK